MDNLEIQSNYTENRDLKTDALLYIDNPTEKNPAQLIINAQKQGCNCLDLSKRKLKEFPAQLLELTSLQYLYLEGNQLTQLPDDLFLRLSNLKWLDLRNNQLTFVPNQGLTKHSSLQYLLLSGNHLQTLPFELGEVKTLSALNLDGNPLDHSLTQISRQGIKAIQQYLRDKLHPDHDSSSSSDEELQKTPRYSPRKSNHTIETTLPDLSPLRVQSCRQHTRRSYSAKRLSSPIRPQSGPEVKTKPITKKTNLLQPLVKQPDIPQSRPRSFIQSKDYQKPFFNNRRSVQITTEDHITQPSSELIVKQDDIRRRHDRQIQDRIRQITDQMLRRRLEARRSIFEERRQVKHEVQELRRIIIDGRQHRPSVANIGLKTFSGKINAHRKTT